MIKCLLLLLLKDAIHNVLSNSDKCNVRDLDLLICFSCMNERCPGGLRQALRFALHLVHAVLCWWHSEVWWPLKRTTCGIVTHSAFTISQHSSSTATAATCSVCVDYCVLCAGCSSAGTWRMRRLLWLFRETAERSPRVRELQLCNVNMTFLPSPSVPASQMGISSLAACHTSSFSLSHWLFALWWINFSLSLPSVPASIHKLALSRPLMMTQWAESLAAEEATFLPVLQNVLRQNAALPKLHRSR